MRYAMLQDFNNDFWTDGHYGDSLGVFVHSDNSELTWFGPRQNCWCGNDGVDADHMYKCSGGGDAFYLYLGKNAPHRNGAWCADPSTTPRNFICEGIM